MNSGLRKILITIMKHIKQREFNKALDILNTIEHNTDPTFEIIRLYIYIESEQYIKAESMLKNEPEVNVATHHYFLKQIYKGFNMLSNFKNIVCEFSKSDIEKYEACILDRKYQEAREYGIKLIHSNANLLLFAIICQLIYDEKRETVIRLLNATLEKNTIRSQTLRMLASKNYDNLALLHLNKITKKGKAWHLLLMDLHVKDHDISQWVDGNATEYLLDKIDDWRLYEYGLNKNLELKERKTMNYKFYKLIKTKDIMLARDMILNIENIMEIQKIYEIIDWTPIENIPLAYKILFLHLLPLDRIEIKDYLKFENLNDRKDENFNDMETLISAMYNIYLAENEYMNILILLALLIATKKEKYLIFAMYISRYHYEIFPNHYEIALIYMFLCRFFCYYPEVVRMMKYLDIKQIQQQNLAFIWSDLNVLLNINDNELIAKYKHFYYNTLKEINCSILTFIKEGLFEHAVSMLELKNSIEENCVFKEIQTCKIISENSKTIFSSILGEKCAYLFDKVSNANRSDEFKGFMNIYNIYDKCDNLEIENELCNFSEEFIGFVRDMVSYRQMVTEKKLKIK
ncbi:hypothetical protein TCON_2451 [Astathelohania contejeani]|uniref:Uncharacterized protein n=1 Tax=Astathelohania contejeani TaxID=164912 RepID=A0ABQ7HW08_9MICR|nr:hypothetical protein TCON_2451 [Thelohania contejeani]